MAAVIETIVDGYRKVVINVTGSGAGTTQILVPGTLIPPCTRVRLLLVNYDIGPATSVALTWDAASPTTIVNLSDGPTLDFNGFGGVSNNAGAGVTGAVSMTVVGTAPYSLLLEFAKKDPFAP